MKLCVCGKGGSGKSTVVTLLANGFMRHGKEVMVLDSDESNQSLYWMLGFDGPPTPLMEMVGGKKSIQKKMIAKFSSGEKEPAHAIRSWFEPSPRTESRMLTVCLIRSP